MRNKLIKNFMKDQGIIVQDDRDKIIAVGKKIAPEEFLLYELSRNKFYIRESDDSEYYIDDIIDTILSSLEE